MLEQLLFRSTTPKRARTVRPARDVLTAEHDGMAVLLDLRRAVYYGLDEVGTVMWRELESSGTPAAAARRVCEEFDAPYDTVLADVGVFVRDLGRQRLVVQS